MPKSGDNNKNEFDIKAYRKFLLSQFPSRHLQNKVLHDDAERSSRDDKDDKYANIITTRSGKQIKIPSTAATTAKTAASRRVSESPKGTGASGSSKPITSTSNNGKSGAGQITKSNTSSKKPSKLLSSAPCKGSFKKKFLKKSFHQPPPLEESSSEEDGDEDAEENGSSKSSGSGSGSEESYSEDKGGNMSKKRGGFNTISKSRRKQATNHLKQLLSNKMNIIISMDKPPMSSKKMNLAKKSKKQLTKSKECLYTDEENEDDVPEDDETIDDDDDDDDESPRDDDDSEDDDDDDDDEEEDSDDEDEDDDEDDDEYDEDDEDDDDDDDEYDEDDDDEDDDDDEYEDDCDDDDDDHDVRGRKATSLSRNGSYNSLFSSGSGLDSGASPTKQRMSFTKDPEFIKFIQKSPLSLGNKSEKEEKTMDTLFASIRDMYKSDPENQILRAYYYQLKNACNQLKREREKRTMKEKKRNCNEFKKLLKKRNSTNDLNYFKKQLTPAQQAELIEEIKEVNKISYSDVPYRLSVLQSTIPRMFKSIALNKISTLRNMDPGSGEFYKVKNWVDGFMKIPFDNEKQLPVTLETHGREACSKFMDQAKKQLDDAVYGLDDAKLQLMQLVGQWIANPNAMGTAVAIHGPPGTGKTSLIKEGVSKILGRDFAFIALGGATDSSFLEGHSYTYEGSTWGKIVDILIQCKSTNPVIYFDELDKISDTPKGDEIVGILTHLTDASQNSHFHDKYFSEIAFDLSKCLFIFSYNDESRVNRVLLDRMFRIRTSGYSPKEKITISQSYLIPKIIEQVKFAPDEIRISSEMIEYIVENYTDKEEGVRNLKRCIEIIHTKLNLHRLMTPAAITSMFPKEFKTSDVKFPFVVSRDNMDYLLKKNETKLFHGLYL
jgi:hypothetical protein